MKEKPPAGATLIARLKEGRLRREQELAERKQGKPAVQGKAKAGSVKDETPAIEAAAPAAKTKKAETPAESFAPEAQVEPQVIEPRQLPARTGKERMDIIHREIYIADLRPASDDYELLTEEIRLAGRFAAVGLIAQGMRLARLKDDDIYRQHYPTFEEYCRKEHTMSATYAYRLIRVAEMAERLGEEGHKGVGGKLTAHLHAADAMPDPFEVMLGLGHRHLMALLPLTPDTAEDLLVRGVPLTDENGKVSDRIPIAKATEQQIRQALKLLAPPAEPSAKPRKKAASAPASKSVRTLDDIVGMLSTWADWLEGSPDEKALADKLGSTRDAKRLLPKLEKANQRFVDALKKSLGKQASEDSHQAE